MFEALDINNDAQHLKLFNFDLLQLMDEPVDTEVKVSRIFLIWFKHLDLQGYGSRKDETEAIALSDKVGPDAKVPKTTLIRRFNEHSARVLLASTITKEESTSAHNLKQIHFSSRKVSRFFLSLHTSDEYFILPT